MRLPLAFPTRRCPSCARAGNRPPLDCRADASRADSGCRKFRTGRWRRSGADEDVRRSRSRRRISTQRQKVVRHPRTGRRLFPVAARRVGEGPEGRDVVDGFFVARHASGLLLDDAWDPLGMRATASVGLTLEETPAACVLGYRGCLEGVNARHWSTVLFAAVFVGVGEGALAAATEALRGSATPRTLGRRWPGAA